MMDNWDKEVKSIGNIFPREYICLKGIKNFVNLDYFCKSKSSQNLEILIMRKNKYTQLLVSSKFDSK